MSLPQNKASEQIPLLQMNPDLARDKLVSAQKMRSLLTQEAKKLRELFNQYPEKAERTKFIEAYYRKYYTLTLKKAAKECGLHRPPLRDEILDYPWQVLKFNRVEALKIWERLTK